MDIKALEVMACPFCQGTLSLLKPTEDQAGEGEGQLRCGACDEAFPIHSGIPRMVVPRHTYQTDIASSFGREWQLQADGYFEEHEIYGGSAEAELQDFLRYFGITESDLSGMRVLDAGSGQGRLTNLLAQFGAEVIGLDVSASIEHGHAQKDPSTHVTFVQADLLMPPLKAESFDLVWSDGVIHHTPDPERSFSCLAQLVKPSGMMYVFMYQRGFCEYAIVRDMLMVTPHLPWPALIALSYAAALPLYLVYSLYAALHGLGHRLGLLQARLSAGFMDRHKLKKVAFSYYDCLSPRYRHRSSEPQMRAWFADAGFTEIKSLDLGSMRGRKPV